MDEAMDNAKCILCPHNETNILNRLDYYSVMTLCDIRIIDLSCTYVC